MLTSRQNDFNDLGLIGHLSQAVEDEYIFWNLVVNLRLSPSELDTWTLDEMRKATALLDMRQDYKSAWNAFYDVGEKK
ncbi:hypothetical protein SAMN05720470_10847 [Fibrobacter sp. UWOV1]|nr:hypothetical protein SAMN05720470_10847 [Fibrobacter sp. UWOV1]